VESCPGCEKIAETERYNQPSLPAISYRMGTHGQIFQNMLGQLHTIEILRKQLTTRDSDDFAIALLDGWAVVGDILTFYQERIANEGYLRTATERRSVLEMARTIGYELNPGVAASTYLALTVDGTDPNYATVSVPQGVQVQNIPAQGKLPQTFETSEEFEAHVEWNEMKPHSIRHQTLAIDGDGKLYLLSLADEGDPAAENVSNYYLVNEDPLMSDTDNVIVTEVNQIYLSGVTANLKDGEVLLLVGKQGETRYAIVRKIVTVETDKELDRIIINLSTAEETDNKTTVKTVEADVAVYSDLVFNADTVARYVLYKDISEETLQAIIAVNNWEQNELLKHISAIQASSTSLTSRMGVFALREHTGFFGSNAPMYNDSFVEMGLMGLDEWDTKGWEIWKDHPDNNYYSGIEELGADVYLEKKVDDIGKDSWVVFDNSSLDDDSQLVHRYFVYQIDDKTDQSVTGFSISGKSTGLKLKDINGNYLQPSDKSESPIKVRNTSVHVRSEALELLDLPVEDDLKAEATDTAGETVMTGVSSIMLDTLVLGLQIGQPVIVNGELTDAEGVIGHEVAITKEIIHTRGHTIIYFEEALNYMYQRDTVTINGNVVKATHGETVEQVLGSGDGTATNQRFILKKPPLTYVSAATTTGSKSTLNIKVNGIEWEQVLSLYNAGSGSQYYIVRLDNDGNVTVKFGDGKQGARLPTGEENIVATYRSGIGSDGDVAANSIKLLKTRPQGIKDVNNPIAASGSQEPETLDESRTNAPRTVLTMDRIVSLKDYEDFARIFTGIGKAQAVVLWNGKSEIVHLTIADSYGDTIDSGSATYENITKAIDTYRDHLVAVQIDTFEKCLFHVEADLLIDDKFTSEDVLKDAKSALEDAFSFEKRDFGQLVTSAEVISILQQVSGVVAVDLDKLYLTDVAYETDTKLGPNQSQPAAVLPCSIAKWPEGGDYQKAQLLLINTTGITLEEEEE
jgi:hypothetical protein